MDYEFGPRVAVVLKAARPATLTGQGDGDEAGSRWWSGGASCPPLV